MSSARGIYLTFSVKFLQCLHQGRREPPPFHHPILPPKEHSKARLCPVFVLHKPELGLGSIWWTQP